MRRERCIVGRLPRSFRGPLHGIVLRVAFGSQRTFRAEVDWLFSVLPCLYPANLSGCETYVPEVPTVLTVSPRTTRTLNVSTCLQHAGGGVCSYIAVTHRRLLWCLQRSSMPFLWSYTLEDHRVGPWVLTAIVWDIIHSIRMSGFANFFFISSPRIQVNRSVTLRVE